MLDRSERKLIRFLKRLFTLPKDSFRRLHRFHAYKAIKFLANKPKDIITRQALFHWCNKSQGRYSMVLRCDTFEYHVIDKKNNEIICTINE